MANTSVLQNQLSDADTFPMGNRCPGNGVYHSICYQIETEKSVICALAGLDGDHKYSGILLLKGYSRDASRPEKSADFPIF
ncbi:uncharacterized protein L3040_002372 [Drepanopeziza brunnea f. sp. 'multigermtubi']|uniref:uncharacterized protein n=1 Tax=Drepanopeziza brunnea f. sp. 'multigermtubi' TaxID=698441 RepID=UPI0023A4A3C6|nr:hypothetical protein L3040_002372 [Drepanopeziza brunnea f. sp. 'multigermtubi']